MDALRRGSCVMHRMIMGRGEVVLRWWVKMESTRRWYKHIIFVVRDIEEEEMCVDWGVFFVQKTVNLIYYSISMQLVVIMYAYRLWSSYLFMDLS